MNAKFKKQNINYISSSDSDNSDSEQSDSEYSDSNQSDTCKNNDMNKKIKKNKKKYVNKIQIKLSSGFIKSKNNTLKNREMSKFVNKYNTKNNQYFEPEKFKALYNYGLKFLPNSNIYENYNKY